MNSPKIAASEHLSPEQFLQVARDLAASAQADGRERAANILRSAAALLEAALADDRKRPI